MRGEGNPGSAHRFDDEADNADRYGELIQQYLLQVQAAQGANGGR